MEIKTKLDLYDECFFMMNNKVCESEIDKIEVVISHNGCNRVVSVIYEINKNPEGSQYTTRFSTDEIFASKQDLLDSL